MEKDARKKGGRGNQPWSGSPGRGLKGIGGRKGKKIAREEEGGGKTAFR